MIEIADEEYRSHEAELKTCPYGKKYFCDGTPNKSQKEKDEVLPPKEPCIYLRNGKCVYFNKLEKKEVGECI